MGKAKLLYLACGHIMDCLVGNVIFFLVSAVYLFSDYTGRLLVSVLWLMCWNEFTTIC